MALLGEQMGKEASQGFKLYSISNKNALPVFEEMNILIQLLVEKYNSVSVRKLGWKGIYQILDRESQLCLDISCFLKVICSQRKFTSTISYALAGLVCGLKPASPVSAFKPVLITSNPQSESKLFLVLCYMRNTLGSTYIVETQATCSQIKKRKSIKANV